MVGLEEYEGGNLEKKLHFDLRSLVLLPIWAFIRPVGVYGKYYKSDEFVSLIGTKCTIGQKEYNKNKDILP